MRSDEPEQLLNIKRVGDLLQPYLPKINAYALLKKDSKRDNPLLNFTVINGEACYRIADVKHFLRTLLLGMQQNPLYDQIRSIPLLIPDTLQFRRASDRRRLVQRRSSVITHLSEKFERRFDDKVERRTVGQRERRQGFSDTH